MADKIIDVHSISAAAPGLRRSSDGQKVVCFALASVANPDHLGMSEKMLVPLFLGDTMVGLIGREVDLVADDLEFAGTEPD